MRLADPNLTEADAQAVADCVREGWISGVAPQVGRFEAAFAGFVGARHGIATTSGTSALHLSLAAAGIGPNDEVIIPTLTFVATANAVTYTGARVVFADVDPETWTIAPASVAGVRTTRTRAVVPVHLAGYPADIDGIRTAAPGSVLIEDAAQAIGCTYRGRMVGSLATAACFSFFSNKVITTGEGGMITTDDDGLAEHARHLRAHAKQAGPRYIHDRIAFNYRMTGIQAALGLSQLARVSELISRRERVGEWYRTRLAGSDDFAPRPELPASRTVPSFLALIARSASLQERALAALKEARVEARPMFEPLHTLDPYRSEKRFPVAEDVAARSFFVPCSASTTEVDVDRITAVLRGAARTVGTRSTA